MQIIDQLLCVLCLYATRLAGEEIWKSALTRQGGVHGTVYVHTDNLTEPVSFENGRMYFIVNDEHIDITDQVSETEPYIYQFTDEEDVLHYWIIGKNGPESEHYGFAEYLHPSESERTAGYVARTNGNTAPWLDKAKETLGFDF